MDLGEERGEEKGLSLQCWHQTGPQLEAPFQFLFLLHRFQLLPISRIFVATSVTQELATDAGAMPKSKISNLADNTG